MEYHVYQSQVVKGELTSHKSHNEVSRRWKESYDSLRFPSTLGGLF